MQLHGLALRADGVNQVLSIRLDGWTGKDQIRPRDSEEQARPWGQKGSLEEQRWRLTLLDWRPILKS